MVTIFVDERQNKIIGVIAMPNAVMYTKLNKKTGEIASYRLGDSKTTISNWIPIEKYIRTARSAKAVYAESNESLSNTITTFKEVFETFIEDSNDMSHYFFSLELKQSTYLIYESCKDPKELIKKLKDAGLVNFELVVFVDRYFITVPLTDKYIEDLQAFFKSDDFSTEVHTWCKELGLDPNEDCQNGLIDDPDLTYPVCDGCGLLVDLSLVADTFGLVFKIC